MEDRQEQDNVEIRHIVDEFGCDECVLKINVGDTQFGLFGLVEPDELGFTINSHDPFRGGGNREAEITAVAAEIENGFAVKIDSAGNRPQAVLDPPSAMPGPGTVGGVIVQAYG